MRTLSRAMAGGVLLLLVWSTAAAAGERFTDNGDGTVTDHQLQVMWAKADSLADVDWRQAELYCRMGPNQVLGKYDNWRLPTIEELKSLYVKEAEPREAQCGREVRVTPEVELSCAWVWSSEVRSITAVVFNFQRGIPFTDRMVHKRHYRALPVRDLEGGQ